MPASAQLDPDRIADLFTRDGQFLCARWGRPVVPVIFGLADESLGIFSAAIRAAYAHAGHPLTDVDPDMGANLMMFFCENWGELDEIPDIDRLTARPDLPDRLAKAEANTYQMFRFEANGQIKACLSFVRMSGSLQSAHPANLAETLAMRSLLTFAQDITASKPLSMLIRVAYDPVLPGCARDPSHALRLAARLT